MLNPVHQRHRDQLSIGSAQSRVIKNRQFRPPDTEILGHPFDYLPHRAAKMAAGLGDEGDPRRDAVSHDPTV
jgi:hypothetical protein